MEKIDIHQEVRKSIYYRLPEDLVDKYGQDPSFSQLGLVSVGYREGHNQQIGYHVKKKASHEFLLKYCLEGSGWFEVGHKRFQVGQGDIIICRKGLDHRYGTQEDKPWKVYWIYFQGDLADYYFRLLLHEEEAYIGQIGKDYHIQDFFRQIIEGLNQGIALAYWRYGSDLAKAMISYIKLRMLNKQDTGNKRIEDIQRYMRNHLHESLELGQVADYVGLSKDHFIRIFKERMGYTPMDYFIRLKMQRASELLIEDFTPVQVIAEELGYEDPLYFSKVFKYRIGCSPSDYRKGFNHQELDLS